MDTPGYDPVSATGQVAGGANLICFTTGRGSVYGCKPAPSLKLATSSRLYRQMADDMDINCGEILDGERVDPGIRATHLSADFGDRFGSKIPFRGSRVWCRRVRALDARGRHVAAYGRVLHPLDIQSETLRLPSQVHWRLVIEGEREVVHPAGWLPNVVIPGIDSVLHRSYHPKHG